jgi:hypothetical protein
MLSYVLTELLEANYKISPRTRTRKKRQTKPKQGTRKIIEFESLKGPAIMRHEYVDTYPVLRGINILI